MTEPFYKRTIRWLQTMYLWSELPILHGQYRSFEAKFSSPRGHISQAFVQSAYQVVSTCACRWNICDPTSLKLFFTTLRNTSTSCSQGITGGRPNLNCLCDVGVDDGKEVRHIALIFPLETYGRPHYSYQKC